MLIGFVVFVFSLLSIWCVCVVYVCICDGFSNVCVSWLGLGMFVVLVVFIGLFMVGVGVLVGGMLVSIMGVVGCVWVCFCLYFVWCVMMCLNLFLLCSFFSVYVCVDLVSW